MSRIETTVTFGTEVTFESLTIVPLLGKSPSEPDYDIQVGAVFILNGEPMGVDLFDSPQTFHSLSPKIVRGYAVDAIDLRSNPASRARSSTVAKGANVTRAEQFMRLVLDAPRTPFAATGLGETWRLFAPDVSGGGLTADGKLVHMSAFRTSAGPTQSHT
jgi:hypothetical protein